MLGLIGKKLGMTRIFDENGVEVQVTVIQAGPCRVTQVKSVEKDGYNALQVGFGSRKAKNLTLPVKGHLKKAGDYFPQRIREFRVDGVEGFEVGQELTVELFSEGEKVSIAGTTKGRGFQGVVKRHGFSGGDDTHGNTSHRVPGSIGASADPSRVLKNTKLPGQYGNSRLTVRNLKVVKVDTERDYLFIKGAVPGPSDGLVSVSKH
ncbi:MAG: 50S ribosomal protein L3 [Candidatus Glassbacteria bacterium]|nr:50S ribosomal protein L3 [Candidatus Glassbacteria bacterium]